MIYVVYAIHIVTCIFLILVVLLQQGKGADLSVFGGGTTQAAFGARGAATLLHKLTVGFFVLFMVTTMSIGILQRGRRASSVMQGVATPKQEEPATAPDVPPAGAPEGVAPEGSTAPAPESGSPAAQPAAPADSGAEAAPNAQAPVAPAPESGAAAATQPQPQSGAAEPPANP